LPLSAPYCNAHFVDLRLSVLGLVCWLFEILGEGVTLLLPHLVDEVAAESVRVDMVLIYNRHLVISVYVSLGKVAREGARNQAVEAHFAQDLKLSDLPVFQSLYLGEPAV